MKWGPAGDIYLIDWHDQNPCHQTQPDDWDYERGRVYRIQLKGTKTKKAEDLGKKTVDELQSAARRTHEPVASPGRPLRLLERTAAEATRRGRARWRPIDADRGASRESPDCDRRDRSCRRRCRVHPRRGRSSNAPASRRDDPVMPQLADRRTGRPSTDARRRRGSPTLQPQRPDRRRPPRTRLRRDPARRQARRDAARSARSWPTRRTRRTRSSRNSCGSRTRRSWRADEARSADNSRNPPLAGRSELAWLAEQAPDNAFVRDQIVPKVMRRLVATGQADDLKLCVEFVAKLKDAASREKALDGLVDRARRADRGRARGLGRAAGRDREGATTRSSCALANKLAVSFRDPAALKRAVETAANTGLAADVRAEAVRQLGPLKATETIALLLEHGPQGRGRRGAGRGRPRAGGVRQPEHPDRPPRRLEGLPEGAAAGRGEHARHPQGVGEGAARRRWPTRRSTAPR